MRKGIIIGIGLLILLALAGTASAKGAYGGNCAYCHVTFVPPIQLTANGSLFNDTHKFDTIAVPSAGVSCTQCHVNPPTTDLSLTLKGQNYSNLHNGANTSGYAKSLVNCTYCHTDPVNGIFTFLVAGNKYNGSHKFDGVKIPKNATGCTACHTDVKVFLPLILRGQNYSSIHNGANSSGYANKTVNCTYCHTDPVNTGDFTLLGTGTNFQQAHKFNTVAIPKNATSCTICHNDVMDFQPMNTSGQNYMVKHNGANVSGYANKTVNCTYCHTDPVDTGNFTLLGTGTNFQQAHKFNGVAFPKNATSCTVCHNDVMDFQPMNTSGQNYSVKHNGANTSGYARTIVNCTYCHADPVETGDFTLLGTGTNYRQIHKFNGVDIPSNATSCIACHTDVMSFMPLASKGPYYNATHRYNGTLLASQLLASPGCYNCHVDNGSNFTPLISGTATYLTSSVCRDCHMVKYNNWTNTMHRVILTSNTTAQSMNLPLPSGWNWTYISYVIIGKGELRYLNETGYRFQRYYANGSFYNYSGSYSSCPACHTTGYNSSAPSRFGLSGITGNWSEDGIGCENCHGAGGNGHNVTVDPTGQDCLKCHYGTSRQGPADTNRHKTAPAEESTSASCTLCHSPYDKYKSGKAASTETAVNVTCSVCHNPHNTTDDQYGQLFSPGGFNNATYSDVKEVKLSFFNATASNASAYAGSNASLTAGNDVYDILTTPFLLYPGYELRINGTKVKDASYGTAPINVTGPQSELLCSICHYRHGIGHVTGVNLTHARANTSNQSKWATCVDCHLSKAGGKADHSFDANNETNYPTNTCSKGTECHVTSAQNLSLSAGSIVPVKTEWEASKHNNAAFVSTNNTSGCAKCHSPMNWNTNASRDNYTIATEDYKGIKCVVCHNIHDMGNSINQTAGKVYAWYNKYSSSYANYTAMANTTELCSNCHSNRPEFSTAGWNATIGNGPHTSIVPHTSTQKDVFTGSYKATNMNFECADCHMYINKTNGTGPLNDSQKVTGHSFRVNATGLQNSGAKGSTACSQCHFSGSAFDTVPNKIASINASTTAKWNSVNASVEAAWATYNAYGGPKNLSGDYLAQAFYKLYQVKNDGSWGVHDPVETNQLLTDAATLANSSIAALGEVTSNVSLKAGWNLVALNGTPSVTAPVSVMNSVIGNINYVWGFNATTKVWELYDPAMPSGLNTLTSMVPAKGYWINAKVDCQWTV